MKTDRELLELAAKAAGYQVDCAFDDSPLIFGEEDGVREWSSLIDDGDAFRLAADLRISVGYWPDEHVGAFHEKVSPEGNIQPIGSDAGAAARLVITMVAAAIGEAMP